MESTLPKKMYNDKTNGIDKSPANAASTVPSTTAGNARNGMKSTLSANSHVM
tara:strand:- start:1407 stop:1562 length:156 start_codon:yes stop_codon:yes gene_type:complete